jgi:hypothetical protein
VIGVAGKAKTAKRSSASQSEEISAVKADVHWLLSR